MSFRSFTIVCLLLILRPLSIFADDSLKVKKTIKNPLEFKRGRFQLAVFPVASFDPASGIELGTMPVFSISPKSISDSTSDFYRSSSLASHFTYSTKNWKNIRSEGQFYTSGNMNYVVFFQFLDAPDYFYGIANDTLNSNPDSYQNRYLKGGFDVSKCLKKIHFLGIKLDLHLQQIKNLLVAPQNQQMLGQSGGNYFGVGPLYKCDTRNNVNYPSKGFLFQTSLMYSISLQNIRTGFATYNVDYRKYSTLSIKTVIAFQASVTHTSGDVPFFKLSTIGGKYNLRGISNKNMYIDNDSWYTQTEIRQMVHPRIGIIAFGGVGNIFEFKNHDALRSVKPVFGFGGRLMLLERDKINLRFDYAFGPNGDKGFYATIREAF